MGPIDKTVEAVRKSLHPLSGGPGDFDPLLAFVGDAADCEEEVVAQLLDLHQAAGEYAKRDGRLAPDDLFFAQQNARAVKNAEKYYRSMFRGRVSSGTCATGTRRGRAAPEPAFPDTL